MVFDEMDFQIQPVNDLLDAPDINADVYETIKRRNGESSLRPLVVLIFKMIILIDFKRKEGEI